MSGRRKSIGEALSERLIVTMTYGDMQRLRALAGELDTTLSALVRGLIRERCHAPGPDDGQQPDEAA